MSERYDRQIRLWGTGNQFLIEETEVELVGEASIHLLDALVKCLLLTGFSSIKSENPVTVKVIEKYSYLHCSKKKKSSGSSSSSRNSIKFTILPPSPPQQEQKTSILKDKMKGSSMANGIILSALAEHP